MQQSKALCRYGRLKGGETSHVTAGAIQALNKANLHRVRPERKYDWDGLGRCLGLTADAVVFGIAMILT